MLLQAHSDSYCMYCGRPIFTKDLYHIDEKIQEPICLSCYTDNFNMSDTRCHHWAISTNMTNSTELIPYFNGWDNADLGLIGDFTCLICSEKVKKFGSTQYIKFGSENNHAGNSVVNSSSYIFHKSIYSQENPDFQIYVVIKDMLKMAEYSRYWAQLEEHLQYLLDRNPSFKTKPPIQEKYIKTRCKIVNYFDFQVHIPFVEKLIESGIKYVKLHYENPYDLDEGRYLIYEYAQEVAPTMDINYLNSIYRKFVMPAYVGTGKEGLDLYGQAEEICGGDIKSAVEFFILDLVEPSIMDVIKKQV